MPDREFRALPEMIRATATARPNAIALTQDGTELTYAALDRLMSRVAASLQRGALKPRDSIAICASTSLAYVAVFLGALRAGVTVAPLSPSATPDSIAGMAADCGARLFFVDSGVAQALARVRDTITARTVDLDEDFESWLAPEGAAMAPVELQPELPFNIIYSSGTTGTPKGIVQSHGMRVGHIERAAAMGYGPDAITLVSTPLYSNTTLVSLFPTLGLGGTAILMRKFDAARYLEIAEQYRVTHTMLVPVQYARLMAYPLFDQYDLSSFVLKTCTSAPFAASLKADVLKRWPGGLVEIFGMTEGGGTCILAAHLFPDKLHTVGRPAAGHDIRIVDDDGRELPPGSVGEIVGHSPMVMSGYHNRPEQTAAATWVSPEGTSFIRTGDVGRFDVDGFLELLDRKKDMIISGGFNIYPSDLEAVLRRHPDVADVAVVGAPSAQWGETPVAFVVLRGAATTEQVKAFVNAQVGKTQRLADVRTIPELPRSPIGKVLKRDLRDLYLAKSQ